MGKCLYGAKLEHHCSSPLNEASKNACSCELHSVVVTKICTAPTPSCLCSRTIAKRGFLIPRIWPSVRMEQLRSHRTDFHEIWYLKLSFFFLENLSGEITFQPNHTIIAGTLYEDLCTCMKTPRWLLRNFFFPNGRYIDCSSLTYATNKSKTLKLQYR